MKTFLQNKLWRTKMIEKARCDGSLLVTKSLDHDAYVKALLAKLVEEVDEVVQAHDQVELQKEIGDVYEVIDCLLDALNIEKNLILQLQAQKKLERGSFTNDSFVVTAACKLGSSLEQYFLANQSKYPEVTNQ